MQIVIDIPDEDYNRIKDTPDAFNSLTSRLYKATKHGTPLPKGHGRLIDADRFINDFACHGHIDDMGMGYFRTVTPTIIEADKSER